MNYTVTKDAQLRFFNAAAINEPINIQINDKNVINGLKFRQASMYLPVKIGLNNFKIYGADSGRLLYNQSVRIDGNKFITVSAVKEPEKLDLVLIPDMPESVEKRTESVSGVVKNVADKFNNIISVTVDEYGKVVNDVKNEYGQIIIHAGDELKKISDRLGNILEVIVDNTGKIVAMGLDNLGKIIQGTEIRIGNTIRKVVDQLGKTVDVVLDDLNQIIGWVTEQITRETNKAQLRFVHLAPGGPAVDITLPDGTVIFADTKYKQKTKYIPVGAGLKSYQIRRTGTNQVLLNASNLNLLAGNLYSLYLVGNAAGAPGLDAVLLLDQK